VITHGLIIGKDNYIFHNCPFLIKVYDGKWSFKQLLKPQSKKPPVVEEFEDLSGCTPPGIHPLLIITKKGSELFVLSDIELPCAHLRFGEDYYVYHIVPFLENVVYI